MHLRHQFYGLHNSPIGQVSIRIIPLPLPFKLVSRDHENDGLPKLTWGGWSVAEVRFGTWTS